MKVSAYICEVGRERDNNNIWRWVLPYQHPCKCTEIIMGGLNTWTPIRPFTPTYVNRPLLSDDGDKIRKHYGLTCVGKYEFVSHLCIGHKDTNKISRMSYGETCLYTNTVTCQN